MPTLGLTLWDRRAGGAPDPTPRPGRVKFTSAPWVDTFGQRPQGDDSGLTIVGQANVPEGYVSTVNFRTDGNGADGTSGPFSAGADSGVPFAEYQGSYSPYTCQFQVVLTSEGEGDPYYGPWTDDQGVVNAYQTVVVPVDVTSWSMVDAGSYADIQVGYANVYGNFSYTGGDPSFTVVTEATSYGGSGSAGGSWGNAPDSIYIETTTGDYINYDWYAYRTVLDGDLTEQQAIGVNTYGNAQYGPTPSDPVITGAAVTSNDGEGSLGVDIYFSEAVYGGTDMIGFLISGDGGYYTPIYVGGEYSDTYQINASGVLTATGDEISMNYSTGGGIVSYATNLPLDNYSGNVENNV